ncbi:MAG TPA: TIM-barrel domain-containing protein [Acidobacteriaceae bacterium]|jgi:alpha-glucosidase
MFARGAQAAVLSCFFGLLSLSGTVGEAIAQNSFSKVTGVKSLPNGIELRDDGLIVRIVALRDDVIRLRAGRDGALPEDASWAVLPEARAATVQVAQDTNSTAVGFHTADLRVEAVRATGLLTIRDAVGRVVLQQALPIKFLGEGFRLTDVMPSDEHYFGLGDKTGPLDRRGHAFTMWNTDAYRFQESTDPLYKSIPFFMTYRAGTATGILLDNTWRSSFDFGKELANAYSFGADGGPLDCYIVAGPSPRHVVETYAWLTGKAPLPPRWMLGFQQSRYSYVPARRLMEIANRLRADHIPADALYLDIDFQHKNRPFTVDTQAFPDLEGLLAKLRAMDFHVVAITDLHIAKAPGESYAPYDSGIAGNEFLHRPDGSVYSGSVWPGPSVFPDFGRSASRAWWGTLYQPFTAIGFAGFWNDMNEPSIFDSPTGTMPLDTVHRIEEPGFITRTATHAEMHNVYGMENSRATYEGLRKLQPDVRPFVLTRASYAGGQRYAATWTGDNSSTWNHLRMTSPMLKSLGLSGFSFSGADVGGFAGTATPDLLTKWLEIAAFHPIDRDHTEKGTGDQEPWIGGTQHEDIRRRYIEERYRLMPYLYTVAEETSRTGMPMMRPLFLDFPEAARDKHPIDLDANVDAEFLLGHDLLIAPSPYPEAPDAYGIEFPSAEWYDYWTGQRVPAPVAAKRDPNAPAPATDMIALSMEVHPQLETLPVYVRGGAILPIAPLTQSTEETPRGPLTLRVYAGPDCRGSIYTDDGKSFAYTKGVFLREEFHCSVAADGMTFAVSRREGSFVPWWSDLHVEVFGWSPSSEEVSISGGAALPLVRHEHSFEFTLPDNGGGAAVSVR